MSKKLKKIALITGINGQDGSYLSELLLKKNYHVHGLVKNYSLKQKKNKLWRINHLVKEITLHKGNLNNYKNLKKIITKIYPDELYHLGGESFVHHSFKGENSAFNVNINSIHYILSILKNYSNQTKLYYAGSSEMFGDVKKFPQNEKTNFNPISSYGISKCAGFYLVKNYRNIYKLHASTGIMYNHESSRRSINYVTRKITSSISNIVSGKQKFINLGNIKSKRDWGHAQDYVLAMWKILQQKKPDDYVIGTGKLHSVEQFLKIAFNIVGLDYKKYIVVDQKFIRPTDTNTLVADFSNARKKLNWKPKINFTDIIKEMVHADIKRFK